MAEQIEPKLSPMSLSFIGKIEPTETILGRVKEMNIYMDGSLLVSIKNSTIIQEDENLIILCQAIEERIFIPQNVRVEVILSPKMDTIYSIISCCTTTSTDQISMVVIL